MLFTMNTASESTNHQYNNDSEELYKRVYLEEGLRVKAPRINALLLQRPKILLQCNQIKREFLKYKSSPNFSRAIPSLHTHANMIVKKLHKILTAGHSKLKTFSVVLLF